MIINTKSWHYKMYCWTYTHMNTYARAPEYTNLCQYVQRIFWMTFLIALLWFVGGGICGITYYVLIAPFVLLVGRYPKSPNTIIHEGPSFNQYSGLSIGKSFQLYPLHVIAALAFIAIEYVGWHYYFGATLGIHAILGLIAIVCGLGYVFLFSKSDTVFLFKEWLKAKKNQVCPLVEFKDEPTSNK